MYKFLKGKLLFTPFLLFEESSWHFVADMIELYSIKMLGENVPGASGSLVLEIFKY